MDGQPGPLQVALLIHLGLVLQSGIHRAAEIGSIACADVLLEFKADIDATNLSGETPFHVAAQNGHIKFGSHLLEKKAKNNCQLVRRTIRGNRTQQCTKCRYLTQMIQRDQKRKKQETDEELAKQKAAEEAANL